MNSTIRTLELILRNGSTTQKFVVNVTQDDTIANVKSKLSSDCGLRSDLLKIIFCGRNLDENTKIHSLSLTPQTNLTVTIRRTASLLPNTEASISSASDNSLPRSNKFYNSFYVFCKKCEKQKCGKLRAYCTECQSSFIIFKREPSGWTDVLGYKKLEVNCKQCKCNQLASVHFKCVDCGEDSVPLTQLRRNASTSIEGIVPTCEVCDDSDFLLYVTFSDCSHKCCIDCFKAYCLEMQHQQNFVMKPMVGFTVTCPVYRCIGYVGDVHQFYLLGVNAYKSFQRQTTELFVAQQSERKYCPAPSCGAVFFVDADADNTGSKDEKMILCPECLKLFCQFCNVLSECKCHEKLEDASLQTIRYTSKNCPKCKAPTERNGGCAHIYCTQCQHQWCFVCGSDWTDECQWDHWFE